jgi:nicotinate-nucleotide adenylyltransferase
MPPRVGIFGGSFDPVHRGHVDTIDAAARRLRLERVVFVPSRLSPGKQTPKADARHRVAMLALALEGHPGWSISFEELDREPPSYTIDTLRAFASRGRGGDELWLLMGTDTLSGLDRWREPEEVVKRASIGAFHRAPFAGAGLRVPTIPGLASRLEVFDAGSVTISSTEIRRDLAEGSSLAGRVPDGVEEYITKHGLYGAEAARF